MITGKNVLLTGGANGIGYELSKLMTDAGAKVVVFDKMRCENPVQGVRYMEVDITDESQVKGALSSIEGEIDVLVNNAGVMRRGNFFETEVRDFDFVMDINVKGSWLMLKCAQPKMAKDACVLQMSSRHGLFPKADPAAYSLSKLAVSGLMEIVAKTCPGWKIKVAYPGSVDTALSWHGVKDEDKDAKKKLMVSPEVLAQKLFELLTGDHGRLMFNEESWSYYFE